MTFGQPRHHGSLSKRIARGHRVAMAASLLSAAATAGGTQTIRADLKLRTGGAVSGLVVEHNRHGLVIVADSTPYVFAWNELEAAAAYRTKRDLLVSERGGARALTAEDHFALGTFALSIDRPVLAAESFRRASERNKGYGSLIPDLFRDYRRRHEAAKQDRGPFGDEEVEPESTGATPDVRDALGGVHGAQFGAADFSTPISPETRARVMNAYRTFGAKVRDVLGGPIDLIETDHFLIWTDWNPRHHDLLRRWSESMYAALCEQFRVPLTDNVFLAKCPVFCWQSKLRFRKFAQLFDGYDGTGAVGYTRSIEQSGHVHVVLFRRGRAPEDFDRFAATLVHEGTHAFLHRLHSSRLIPHWINEGYADLIAQRVLGGRCNNAANAELLAQVYVRYGWPVTELLHGVGPIGVGQYALAHSVIAHLEGRGRARFAGFIRSLKEGQAVADALAEQYDGLTLEQLEADWRSSIEAVPPGGPAPGDSGHSSGRPTG